MPKTGQTTTYAVGDDGDLRKGVAWAYPRFTDNGDGTVTDNLTGLIWLQNANCGGAQTRTTALANSNGMADPQCGLTDGSQAGDWRLPNVRELYSLIHSGQPDSGAWLNGQGFTNVQAAVYWSSTTDAAATTDAWTVHLVDGAVNHVIKTDGHYVWQVRGGQ